MFFEKPMQVKFWDPDSEGWFGGIGYRDEVICGCCGTTLKIEEILKSDPNGIVKLPWWVDINDEIRSMQNLQGPYSSFQEIRSFENH